MTSVNEPNVQPRPERPLMTIGAFSRASLVSVRSLRAYHERGILVPAAIDPTTGYRAYHPGQLPDAVALRHLRGLDVPLPVIKEILDARDPEVTAKLLADHRAEMQARLAETERIVADLQHAVDEPGPDGPIHLRPVDHQHAVAITGRVVASDFPSFLGHAYERLGAAIGRDGLRPVGSAAALYGAEISDGGPQSITAYMPVDQPRAIDPGTGVEIIELPAATVAIAVHEGDYTTIGDTYASLGAWVAYHADSADEPVREIYQISYGQTDDPRRFRTEIQWPVRPLPSPSAQPERNSP